MNPRASGDTRIASLRDSLRSQLWPTPVAAVIVAIVAGQFLPFIDQEVQDKVGPTVSAWIFGGGPAAASNLLQTIAGAMVTVTALTFSLTVVTLQLASSQFSPRLLRTFTSDRIVHSTLALFLSTFAFALTVLRSIRSSTAVDDGFVPKISTTVAFLLSVASVLALVGFLSHLARQIRVESMLKKVFDETESTLASIFPDTGPQDPSAAAYSLGSGPEFRPIESCASGFLLTVNSAAIRAAAAQAGALVVFAAAPGDSLVRGVPFASAADAGGGRLEEQAFSSLNRAVADNVAIGFERTSVQDATLGLQQLLDIACRALSPGINDATTAVHAIGHVSALLCGLAGRRTGSSPLLDDDGTVRVILKRPRLEDMLELTMRQLLRYAMDDPRAAERTISMLGELDWVDSGGRLARVLTSHRRRVAQALLNSPLEKEESDRLVALVTATGNAFSKHWGRGAAAPAGNDNGQLP